MMTSAKSGRLARVAFASFGAAVALAGSAPADAVTRMPPTYTESYTFSTPYTISDAVTLNTYIPYDDGTGGGPGATSGDNYRSNGPGVVTLTDPFLKEDNIASTFFLGTSSLDTTSPNHLLVAVNDGFAVTAVGASFASVFGTAYSEAQVTGALEGLYNPGSDDDARNAAYNTIFGFADQVFKDNASFSPKGDSFTLLGFSDGKIVGTGRASFTSPMSAAPEPASWALMIAGFGLVGTSLRRQRREERSTAQLLPLPV